MRTVGSSKNNKYFTFGSEELSKFCGKALTIKRVNDSGSYSVEENSFYWTDDMFEGLVEKESQHKEYELIKAAQRVEIAAKILEEAKEELRKLI